MVVRVGRSRLLAVLAVATLLLMPADGATASPPAAPGAPSITSVTPGDGTLTVAFTPPAGGAASSRLRPGQPFG